MLSVHDYYTAYLPPLNQLIQICEPNIQIVVLIAHCNNMLL